MQNTCVYSWRSSKHDREKSGNWIFPPNVSLSYHDREKSGNWIFPPNVLILSIVVSVDPGTLIMPVHWQEWTVVHMSLFVTFLVSSLTCNAIHILAYFIVKPYNLELFRTISSGLCWTINAQVGKLTVLNPDCVRSHFVEVTHIKKIRIKTACSDIKPVINQSLQVMQLGTYYSGSEVNLYADDEVRQEMGKHHAIFLLNHHYEVDWLFAWICADAYNCLGNGKVIAKKMLKYVPTIGISWALNDTIFLDRNWEKDKHTLTESMNVLASYTRPFWLLLYPEGTRLSQAKLEAAQAFSKSRSLPVLQHQLFPRTKGSFKLTRTGH